MSHLCAILNGVAGVVVFSAPSAVSSAWFPPAERTTATAVGILFNNLGNALRGPIYNKIVLFEFWHQIWLEISYTDLPAYSDTA